MRHVVRIEIFRGGGCAYPGPRVVRVVFDQRQSCEAGLAGMFQTGSNKYSCSPSRSRKERCTRNPRISSSSLTWL